MLRKLLLAAWFAFLGGLNCAPALGQSPAPPNPAITQQADKNREDARNAARAAFEKGMRLYREQKAESLRAAILLFEAAAKGHAEAGDQKNRGRVLVWIGLAYNDLGQKREALKYYQQALSIARAAGDRDGEAASLSNIGTIYSQLGQKPAGLKYLEQSLAIERELGQRKSEADTLNNIGMAYSELGQPHEALKYFEQALPIRREVGDHDGEGVTLNNLGLVNDTVGRRQEALKYFEQALAIRREVGDRRGEARTLSNIGRAYSALGQKQEALHYLEQALAIERGIGNREGEAATLNNLGYENNRLGKRHEALLYYQQALPILREVEDREGEAAALSNVGMIASDMGKKESALEFFKRSLAIERQIGNRTGEAVALNNIGAVYRELGQKQEALKYFAQALPLRSEVGDRQGQVATLANLMGMLRFDRPQLAILFGKQEIAVLQSLRRDVSGLSSELQHSFARQDEDSYRGLAGVLIMQGRLLEAQRVLDLLKEQEYFNFIGASGPAGSGTPVAMTTEDERALLALISEVAQLDAKATTAEEQERRQAADQELKAARAALPELFGATGEVKHTAFVAAMTASDLQKQLPPGTVALYTVQDEKALFTLLVAPSGLKSRKYDISPADFKTRVLTLRDALRDPTKDARPAAQEMYRIVIGDLQKELDQAKVATLLWSLDDNLRYIPMAALHDGKQYLAERYRSFLYTKIGGKNTSSSAPLKVWAGGMSQASEGLPALGGVRAELQAIVRQDGAAHGAGVMPGMVVLDEAFTADALRNGLKEKYPLLHIASHFVLRPGTENDSFLLLGNGRLNLGDLRKSAAYDFSGVQLLTLSACDTAVGDGREIEGFAVVAEVKGAHSIMASLWEVNDRSTSEFMRRFYGELSKNPKLSKAEALQRAQLELLRGDQRAPAGESRGFRVPAAAGTAKYSHPYYWAPFILMGDWR